MTGERRTWTIGGLSRDDAGCTVTKVREITEVEFAELERKVTFVVELASQTDYGRLLAAVARLDALLEVAREELEAEGRPSPRSAASLPLDLAAAVEAARRLEALLADKIDAAADLPPQVVSAFHGLRHGIRASGPYLVAYELADRGGQIKLVLRDRAVHFDGHGRNSAQQVARGLLGLLFSLVRAYLDAFQQRFEDVAIELERFAAAVTDGSPCLISYGTGPSGRERVRFRNIPLQEVEALRRFYVEGSASGHPEELVQAALALMGATLQAELHMGDVNIAAGLVDGDTADSVNDFPTAKFQVDLRLLGSAPLDYWGPVSYRVAQNGYEEELFAGAVQAADVQGDRIVLECEGATDLTERATGGTLAAGLVEAELVRSLLLVAGLPVNALTLGEPRLGHDEEEVFEVLLPIHGIRVDEPVELGGVEIVPMPFGAAALDGFEREGDVASRLRAAFTDADSYGRAHATDMTLPGAEEAGVSAVETIVAWLVTRHRYGFARLPDGRIQPFTRQQSLRVPKTGTVVLVRGMATGRRWMRFRHVEEVPITRTLAPGTALLDPPLPPDLLPEERHALLALRRATSEAILESQMEALWEAIEFYAAGTRVEKPFKPSELKRLRKSLPEWLSADQRQRFEGLIKNLNTPPLGVRLTSTESHAEGVTDCGHEAAASRSCPLGVAPRSARVVTAAPAVRTRVAGPFGWWG